ncbi:MAG: hypothetical protein AABY22_25850, partial [Nanoarchaeota archaeon]
ESISKLKNYGTHNYNLEFHEAKNSRYNKESGRWEFDRIYYAIQWYPTEPIQIQITKTIYINGNKTKEENLSEKVLVTDKKKVQDLINKFKKLYKKVK